MLSFKEPIMMMKLAMEACTPFLMLKISELSELPYSTSKALQKRQKFEKEDLLVELEERRNLLIKRLREYKGTEWEIVQEAQAFVGEPVQREDDLMLPPYQSSTRDAHTRRGEHSSGDLSRRRASRIHEEGNKQKQSQVVSTGNKTAGMLSSGFVSGLSKLVPRAGKVVLLSAKGALMIASIMFTLSRLEPKLGKWSADRAPSTGFQVYGSACRSSRLLMSSTSNSFVIEDEFCPSNKVLLIQDGIQKCFVKERTEALFKEVITQPNTGVANIFADSKRPLLGIA